MIMKSTRSCILQILSYCSISHAGVTVVPLCKMGFPLLPCIVLLVTSSIDPALSVAWHSSKDAILGSLLHQAEKLSVRPHENGPNTPLSEFLTNWIAPPKLVESFSTLLQDSNSECSRHVILLFETLNQTRTNMSAILDPKNDWALQMFDAWGKQPTEGILTGHLNALGDFDECIGIDEEAFRGLYCTAYLVPSFALPSSDSGRRQLFPETQSGGAVEELIKNMLQPLTTFVMPSNSYCVPSSCSQEEVQGLLSLVFANIFPNWTPFVGYCTTGQKKDLDAGTWAMIGVLIVLAALIAIGSVLDVYLSWKKVKHQGTLVKCLTSFSLPNNVRKWASTGKGEDGFGCIHGIRFFSTSWVVLSHTFYVFTMQGPVWNSIEMNNSYKKSFPFYVILNGYFSVDTFFTMSGLLACYSILKIMDKTRGRLGAIPKLYLHRYLRITPTYALIIGLLANVYQYLGSGTEFELISDTMRTHCRKNWWHNLLYINNVVQYDKPNDDMCEWETWYISNDMQFFIVSPVFVYLLWKWKVIGMVVLGAASVASILTPAIVFGTEKLAPTQIPWKMGNSAFPRAFQVYIEPWYRIGPYLVGMWGGYLLHKIGKKPVRLSVPVVIAGWVLSTGTALACIFGVIPDFDPDKEIDPISTGFYGGLSKFAWGIVIVWVIFACSKGYGGWVNEILSARAFIPLGRLTFCVYLSSVSVQMILQMSLRQPMRFDMYGAVNLFFSHLVMCFIVGFFLCMAFESPFIALEKILLMGPSNSNRNANKAVPETNGTSAIDGQQNASSIPRVKIDEGSKPEV